MKTLFFLALLAVAAWYGWTHRDTLFVHHEGHEAVIENDASSSIERVRLTVDGRTMVKESIPAGGRAEFRFVVNNDSGFELIWQWGDKSGERHWRGGRVATGPMLQRHVFRIDNAGKVTYRTEAKGPAGPN